MNKGDLIRIATEKDVKNEVDYLENQLNIKIDEIDKQGIEVKGQLDNHEKLIYEEENGRHGLKITEDNKLVFYNGYDWLETEVEPEKIRDIGNVPLKVQVADKPPIAEEGRIYYDTEDKLFYVARTNQWWRLFVGGDEKLEQDPPKDAPKLKEKTDTIVTLVKTENMEYRYQGGSWQEDNHFAGLQRNETYHFEQRFKGDEVHKVSPPSPSLKVTTNKGEQAAPSKPTISNIQHDRATVRGETNTEVSLNKSTWYSSPHTFTGLRDKTGYIAYARRKETDTHNVSPASSGASFTTPSKTPGSATLRKGTMQEGYFGSVSSSSLITGDSLASKVGITQGSSQNSNTPWHKFAYKNKILFVAQKTIRKSISWDYLNSKGVVYGKKTIEIDGVKYKVRLLRGALTDPCDCDASDEWAKGSEWNRLIAPLNHQRKDNSWNYPANMESDLQDWETYLDDEEMTVKDVYGRTNWCQEVSSFNSNDRVTRGYVGVSYSDTDTSSYTSSAYGWRPVLEVI